MLRAGLGLTGADEKAPQEAPDPDAGRRAIFDAIVLGLGRRSDLNVLVGDLSVLGGDRGVLGRDVSNLGGDVSYRA